MQGTITCVSDGTTVRFEVERNANAQTNPTIVDSAAEAVQRIPPP
jgi:hypothetical protein